MNILPKLIALNARLEFGSGGMMHQSRKLASLARTNSPSHIVASNMAADRLEARIRNAATRAALDPTGEKRQLLDANKNRIARYQSKLGMR